MNEGPMNTEEEGYECINKKCDKPDYSKLSSCIMDGDASYCLNVVEDERCYSESCPHYCEIVENIHCKFNCSLIKKDTTCKERSDKCIWIKKNEDIKEWEGNEECINKVILN
jgi:hypothetical protein